MNDKELESLLMDEVLEESLDNEMVNSVTPWKKNMLLIVWGLALLTIDINIFIDDRGFSQYVGIILLMLGFRGLRCANRWFFAGYVLATVEMIYKCVLGLIDASIWNEEIWALAFFKNGFSIYFSLGIVLFIYICLWRAITVTEKKAELKTYSVSPLMLVIWNVVVTILALFNLANGWVAVLLIVGYIIMLVGMTNIYKELDRVGYALKASNIIIPNKVLFVAILVISGVMTLTVYLHNEYPMEWKEISTTSSKENEDIKDKLMELGVPRIVIDDMKDEDLQACAGAVNVIVDEQEGEYIDVINVAVQLDSEMRTWRMIYHFSYDKDTKFKGTDVILIGEDTLKWKDAEINGDISGRVLYEDEGKIYESDYYSLGNESRSYADEISGAGREEEIIGKYSFDKKGDSYRGYVSYEIEGISYKFLESWISVEYYHQEKRFVYPAQTATNAIGVIILGDNPIDMEQFVGISRTLELEDRHD